MSKSEVIQRIEKRRMKEEVPHFRVGDTVRVQVKIREKGKERLQAFQGTVIARRGGGLAESFAVYRNAYGCGMERVFGVHSPHVANIEVIRRGRVRRAKLYYLRGKSGKQARVRDDFSKRKEA